MRRPLNITLVTETYPPEINGVAMTLSQLASQLEARGHLLRLVRPERPVQEGEPIPQPHFVETLQVRGFPIPGYRELHFGAPSGRRLERAWQLERPDIIYVATEGPLGWSAVRTARKLGIPVVSGFHTQFHHYSQYYRVGWLQPLVYRYLKALHNRTACTLVPTEAMRCDMVAEIPAVQVLGRGVDCHRFSPQYRSEALRREWGARADDKVFLYVGRLAREKNLPLAIDTFLRLRQRHPDARFVLVGHGPDYSRLYGRMEGLIFTGSKVGEELARHYASADIFLFPSRSETFGNVVLEAMASGLATVAFEEAAAALHIRHGKSGLLAAPGDETTFLRHAQMLLDNTELLHSLRHAARHAMETISWERIGDEFEHILMHHTERRVDDECGGAVAANYSR